MWGSGNCWPRRQKGTKEKRAQERKGIRIEGGEGFYAQRAEMAVAIFFLGDFGEFSSFCLTVESSLYKYMRICLWSDI